MKQAETETGNESEVATGAEAEQQQTEQQEKSGEKVEGGEAAEKEDDGVVVTIGEESPPQEEEPAAPWVRELRTKHRETQRLLKEREAEIARLKAPAQVEVKAKPTLESCDFDPEKFESELEKWHDQKRAIDAKQRIETERIENEKKAWTGKLEAYDKAKGELKVRDYDDAEAAVQESFSTTQQGVILNGAENPAVLVYALGKNPTKAKELASITDPIKFAFAVAKLESQLKVTPRKAAPPPESEVRGSAPNSGIVDSQLERLRAEAARTGDSTKVLAYKRQQKAKQAK